MSLADIYFDPSHPGSFGGPERLAKHVTSKSEVIKFLQGVDAYTKNKRIIKNFSRRKIFSPAINYLWQCDLIIMSKFSRFNKGYKYILTCIDVLRQYAYALPIRTKTGSDIVDAFSKIFESENKPKYLTCDQGTEFFNRKFQAFLNVNNIRIYQNHSELKAAMVERFNRTLMMRIQKYFEFSKKHTVL